MSYCTLFGVLVGAAQLLPFDQSRVALLGKQLLFVAADRPLC